MKEMRSAIRSPYMEWAKLHSAGEYNLATSGVMNASISDLPARIEDLEINDPSPYGYKPLVERLAKKSGVAAESVVTAAGTSMANNLAMAATFEPGDEVLIEEPTYELLLSTAKYLGAEIRRFPRRYENAYAIDPAELKRRVTSRTRLIVITNLHNPTSALTSDAVLREIGEIAAQAGARVLVDEVYMEALYNQTWRSALHLGPQFVVTTSLTKGYGLSGLRCGWILAEPALVERMWRINDVHGATPAHPADRLSVVALDHLDRFAERARHILSINRAALNEMLDAHPELTLSRPAHGTVVFPKAPGGNADAFCDRLRSEFNTSVVPGRFFEAPEHIRIGIGGDIAMTAEGLSRIGRALSG
jgi:aspartate/methionine/tyrosine aminotransferase